MDHMPSKFITFASTLVLTSLHTINYADETNVTSPGSEAQNAPKTEAVQETSLSSKPKTTRSKSRPSSKKLLPDSQLDSPDPIEKPETPKTATAPKKAPSSPQMTAPETSIKKSPPSSPPREYLDEPFWDLTVDALFVKRKGVPQRILAVDNSIPCECLKQRRLITTNRLMNDFPWSPGAKALLSYSPEDERAIEASLVWVNEWKSDEQTSGFGTIDHNFRDVDYAVDYIDATGAKASYESHIWDAEINYWRIYSPRDVDYFSVSSIVGLRWFYLGEHLHLAFYKPPGGLLTLIPPGGLIPLVPSDLNIDFFATPDKSTYWSMTKNRLYGLQVGGNLQVNPMRHWTWELTAKAGIFLNWAWGKDWLGDVNNTVVLRSFDSSKIVGSYMLDGDLLLVYRFRTYCRAHFGWGMMRIWGVATGPGQFSPQTNDDAGRIVGAGTSVWFQRLVLGFNFDF